MNGMMKSVGLLEKNVRKLLRKFRKSLDRLVVRTIAVLEENIKNCCNKRKSSLNMC